MAYTSSGEEIDHSLQSTNYTEYTLKKKGEGMLLLERIGLILAYIAIIVLIWWRASWVLGCISFLAVAIAWWFTWPYVNIEYEYVTASGELTFTEIFGGRKRKKLMTKKIKDMEIIAPYVPEYADKYKGIQLRHDFRSSKKQTEDIFFAVFDNEGKKEMILFRCTNKALKIFKSYNKANTIAVDNLRY